MDLNYLPLEGQRLQFVTEKATMVLCRMFLCMVAVLGYLGQVNHWLNYNESKAKIILFSSASAQGHKFHHHRVYM